VKVWIYKGDKVMSRAEREAQEAAQRQQRRDRPARRGPRSGSTGTTAGGTEAGRQAVEGGAAAPADEVTSPLQDGGPAFDPTQVTPGAAGGESAAATGEHADRREHGGAPDRVDDDALAQQASDLQTELQTGANPADAPPAAEATPETTEEGA